MLFPTAKTFLSIVLRSSVYSKHVYKTLGIMLPRYLELLHVQLHSVLLGSTRQDIRYHGEH